MIDRIIVGPLHTNTYLVDAGKKECIVVDPGSDSEAIIKLMEGINVVPVMVLFTHGHIDHTAGAKEIIDRYTAVNPSIVVGIHRDDQFFLAADAEEANKTILPRNSERAEGVFRTMYRDRPAAQWQFVGGEMVPGTDFTVVHTPGHTAGSVCYFSESRGVLLSGDTFFFDAVGRTDIPGGDAAILNESIVQCIFPLPADTTVFPGHGPRTTIERETRNNRFFSDHGMV